MTDTIEYIAHQIANLMRRHKIPVTDVRFNETTQNFRVFLWIEWSPDGKQFRSFFIGADLNEVDRQHVFSLGFVDSQARAVSRLMAVRDVEQWEPIMQEWLFVVRRLHHDVVRDRYRFDPAAASRLVNIPAGTA